MVATPLSWAKRLLRTSPRGSAAVRVLDRLGAHDAAARLQRARAGEGVVVVEVPTARASRVEMHRLGGRDQVARALHAGGWSAFEPPLPSFVAHLMEREGGVLLDVGANTGLYSLIATAAHPGARAIAFEPVPAIQALLRANIDLNGRADRVAVDDAAVGEATGRATLHLPPAQLDGTIETSASLEPDFKEEIAERLEVRTSTLNDAWAAHGSPPVTMVKIDVEGSEARVLRGAAALVAACRPVVSVEVLGRLDSAPLEEIRSALGYVDVTLAAEVAVVGRAAVAVQPDAPNHLLVPPERLEQVVGDLTRIGGLRVERRDGGGPTT